MQKHAFKILHDMERSWWYIGRAEVITFLLSKVRRHGRVLDYGAGFGGMLPWLKQAATTVDAYEPNIDARAALVTRGYATVLALPDEACCGVYDAVGLFDVVEHIEDDTAFLEHMKSALTPGGSLVITVPAYAWLWSSHDVDNQHFRRYTRGELVKKLRGAGYTIQFAGYWNMFLLPVVALLRLSNASGEEGLGLHPFLNALLGMVIRIEVLIMHIVPLPFGVSVVAVATPIIHHGEDNA